MIDFINHASIYDRHKLDIHINEKCLIVTS